MPNFPLFLTDSSESKDEYCRIIDAAAHAAADSITDGSAYKGLTPQELKKCIHIEDILPDEGLGWEHVLDRLKTNVLPNMLKPSSCGYMAHLHSPATIESLGAELLISTFNQSMDSWDQSPAATEIELEVARMLCRLFGYAADSDGVFTSGGSQSNETAIILARDWFCKTKLNHDVQMLGLPGNFQKLRMYTSEISHFSMEKSAHVLGLGANCVIKVPVDDRKRMNINALRSLLEKDVAEGNIPFLVVGTVGTTDFGSIDPIEPIAALCAEYGMWFHADAAYGSGVILSEKYKHRITGLSLCDSITVDFHKMFLLPISCSAVLVKSAGDFSALTIHADYLNREEDEEDGYTNLVDKSLQTTRRFDALKVWVAFQTRGKKGWSQIITASMENAAYLYNKLNDNPHFETLTEPEISSVVFRLAASDEVNKRVRRELLHEHGFVIGQTASGGHVYLKCTLLNPLLTHQKLDELLTLIQTLGSKAAL